MKLIIHAPTAAALERARSNARNLVAVHPEAEIRIVVNAGGVEAALDTPDPETDGFLTLCENTLNRKGLEPPSGIATTKVAVLLIAELQAEGWAYMRA